jgi:hypothetical protein
LTGKQSSRSTDTRFALDECHRTTDRLRTEMSSLQPYDTRIRAKAMFVPADPSGRVGLFICRPTVCHPPHLGHAKTYTRFDFLLPLLRACGFALTHVPNIADVDDKIIRRARELRIDAPELARVYERASLDDMRAQRTTPWMCARAHATAPTKSSAGSSVCSRRAGRHQGAQLDAQPVEIVPRLGDRRGPACRGRASARSRMPHRPGRTCSGAGCRWSRCVRRAFAPRGLLVAVQFGGQPAREVAVDAVVVGERIDTIQALGRQSLRPDVHVARDPQEGRVSGARSPRGTRRRSAHIRDASG